MFKTLYRCPRTVARHENGPLHESRLRYLEHLAAQGAALHTITAAAGIIYRAAIWMKLDESGPRRNGLIVHIETPVAVRTLPRQILVLRPDSRTSRQAGAGGI
jgi:hypothetical protein